MFPCTFIAYFQSTFPLKTPLEGCFWLETFKYVELSEIACSFNTAKYSHRFCLVFLYDTITRNMKRAKKETGIRFHVVSTWNTRGVFVGGNVPPHKLCFQQHFYFLLYFYFILKNIFACLFSVQKCNNTSWTSMFSLN